MKKLTIIAAIGMLIFSCNKIEEKKKEASASLIENALEAATGNEIDVLDVDNIEKNSATVDIKMDGENLNKKFENGFGSITASKETIAITINAVENGDDNILIGFTGKDLTQNHPIKAKVNNSEGVSMSFSTMRFDDNGMNTMISHDAEAEIVQFSTEKTIIKLKGKIGDPADAESPEKLKFFEGMITLNYPVFQALGSSKKNFTY